MKVRGAVPFDPVPQPDGARYSRSELRSCELSLLPDLRGALAGSRVSGIPPGSGACVSDQGSVGPDKSDPSTCRVRRVLRLPLPPEWAWDWLPNGTWNRLVALILVASGMVLAFGTMGWFGIRRAFGLGRGLAARRSLPILPQSADGGWLDDGAGGGFLPAVRLRRRVGLDLGAARRLDDRRRRRASPRCFRRAILPGLAAVFPPRSLAVLGERHDTGLGGGRWLAGDPNKYRDHRQEDQRNDDDQCQQPNSLAVSRHILPDSFIRPVGIHGTTVSGIGLYDTGYSG